MQLTDKLFFRAVWISDVHLCTKDCQSDVLFDFLDHIRCDYLYVVGDLIDLWALRRKWYWPNQYNDVIHKLLKRSRKGAEVIFIPGNHDDLFREFAGYRFGQVEVRSSAIHTTADGRRFLVIHGDEFDTVVQYQTWLSHLGSWAYGHLIRVNRLVNWARACLGMPYWSFSGAIKRRVKQAVKYINRFEALLIHEARRQGVEGVICGHIHQPAMYDMEGIQYCNTGDWVENCTALVEHEDGRLEIIYWRDEMHRRAQFVAAAGDPATPSMAAPA